MAFRKLFFKRVQGIRDNYLLQEGDIALDESDFQLGPIMKKEDSPVVYYSCKLCSA